MAYDPYSGGQYDYYQNQTAEYGYGYDDQGYNNYGEYGQEANTDTPPPPPDKNWADPRQVNRAYLDKMKTDCVLEEFKGLKEEGLFLLEVFVECVELSKDIIENRVSEDKEEQPFITAVKLLDFPYMEVKEIDTGEKVAKVDPMPSFSDLVQSLYNLTTKKHESLFSQTSSEVVKEDEEIDPSLKSLSSQLRGEVKDEASKKDWSPFELMKGKSILVPKTGLDMIQILQQPAVTVKVANCDVTEDNKRVEGATLGTSIVTVPETFRQSILWSVKPDAILPLLVVETNSYPLLDANGQEVGAVFLTISLTSFSGAVVNCVREKEAGKYDYEDTTLMNSMKTPRARERRSSINPGLKLEILQMGSPFPIFKTSTEILENCFALNLIPSDDEMRRHLLKSNDCDWLRMVEDVLPKKDSTKTLDADLCLKQDENKMAELWRKQKQICRDFKTKTDNEVRTSLFDRLEELQIQTGVAEIEENNPFMELAQTPQSVSQDASHTSKSSDGHLERRSSLKSKRSIKK